MWNQLLYILRIVRKKINLWLIDFILKTQGKNIKLVNYPTLCIHYLQQWLLEDGLSLCRQAVSRNRIRGFIPILRYNVTQKRLEFSRAGCSTSFLNWVQTRWFCRPRYYYFRVSFKPDTLWKRSMQSAVILAIFIFLNKSSKWLATLHFRELSHNPVLLLAMAYSPVPKLRQ